MGTWKWLLLLAVSCTFVFAGTSRAITFTPGHIYAATATKIWEFDATGAALGSLAVPGTQLHGAAFGPDGLLYVTRDGPSVDAIRPDGSVARSYAVPNTGGSLLVGGDIAFSGSSFYVVGPAGITKFAVGSSLSTVYPVLGGFGLATMPNGDFLTSSGYDIRRYSSNGDYLGGIGDYPFPGTLVDPHDVTSDTLLTLVDVRGIVYDAELDRTFVYESGYSGGGGDFTHQVLALKGVTNELLGVTQFNTGSNLALGNAGQLLVGGFRSTGGILDISTLQLVTRLETTPNDLHDQWVFVAVMPLPEPAAFVLLSLAPLALGLRRSRA